MEDKENGPAQLTAAKILAELNDALRICSEPAVLQVLVQTRQSVIEMMESLVSKTLEEKLESDASAASDEL